jgi:hypothetical protein
LKAGLPDSSWYKVPKRGKIQIPNYHEPQNGQSVNKTYQHLPLQDPLNFTEIGIFGLKTNHLATLVESRVNP